MLSRLVCCAVAALVVAPAAATAADGDPTPTISGGPAEGSYTADEFPRFQLSAGPAATITGCAVNGAPRTCSEGTNEIGVSSGRTTFSLTARAEDGRTATVTRSFTVDDVLPVVGLEGTPADGADGQAREATLTPSASDDSPLTLACTLNDAPVGCSPGSPTTFSGLPDGSYSFVVTATDAAGNTQATERFWTVDDTAPQVVDVTGPPEGGTAPALTVFGFAFDSDGSAQCSLDGSPFAACTTPYRSVPLADGVHRFALRGIDGAGNVGGTFVRNFRTGPYPITITPPSSLTGVRVTPTGTRRVLVAVSLQRATTAVARVERRVGGAWKLAIARKLTAKGATTIRATLPGPRVHRLAVGTYRVVVRSPDSTYPLLSSAFKIR